MEDTVWGTLTIVIVIIVIMIIKNMTTFLPNPLSSIFLSFGKRRQG